MQADELSALVIDDPNWQQILSQRLDFLGIHDVNLAGNIGEAAAKLAQAEYRPLPRANNRLIYDVVLCDTEYRDMESKQISLFTEAITYARDQGRLPQVIIGLSTDRKHRETWHQLGITPYFFEKYELRMPVLQEILKREFDLQK